MSCITEILRQKGDMPYLPVNESCVVEGGGSYRGYEYLITFTDMGNRCGYVALTPDDVDYYQDKLCSTGYPDLRCHGDVTFYGNDSSAKELLVIPCNDMWVGFDVGHSHDKRDIKLTKKYFPKMACSENILNLLSRQGKKIRSYAYVEKNCKKIIKQLWKRRGEKCF